MTRKKSCLGMTHFNPRSREGSDANCFRSKCNCIVISIHAPAKGATRKLHPLRTAFQFQSTLPRRERRVIAVLELTLTDFNPRSREGSDL